MNAPINAPRRVPFNIGDPVTVTTQEGDRDGVIKNTWPKDDRPLSYTIEFEGGPTTDGIWERYIRARVAA